MQMGKIQGEAGIPAPVPLGILAGEIRAVLHRGTETGGANHGAVGTGEAPARQLGPSEDVRSSGTAGP